MATRRQANLSRGKRLAARRCPRPPRQVKAAHVQPRGVTPHHFTTQPVGVVAHGVPARPISQQPARLARNRLRVREWRQHAALVPQQRRDGRRQNPRPKVQMLHLRPGGRPANRKPSRRLLAFKRLTPEIETMYMASVNSTIESYRGLLAE